MRTITFSLLTFLSLLFVAESASADRWDSRGWVKLGERRVNGNADRDTIVVGRDDGRFSKVTIVVESSQLDLEGFQVTFGNGDKWTPPGTINHRFRAGSTTRVIDLPGDTRIIKRIDLRYRNVGKWKDASVEVWGWKTGDAPPTKAPAFKWDPSGWQLLGQRSVSYKAERDRITVGSYKGKFQKLAIVVLDNDIELNDFEIKFGKGAPWNPNVRHTFKENERSRIIDFPGDERVLKYVDFKYRSVGRGGPAKVQVWAR